MYLQPYYYDTPFIHLYCCTYVHPLYMYIHHIHTSIHTYKHTSQHPLNTYIHPYTRSYTPIYTPLHDKHIQVRAPPTMSFGRRISNMGRLAHIEQHNPAVAKVCHCVAHRIFCLLLNALCNHNIHLQTPAIHIIHTTCTPFIHHTIPNTPIHTHHPSKTHSIFLYKLISYISITPGS